MMQKCRIIQPAMELSRVGKMGRDEEKARLRHLMG
jgi:hypothetical protein